MTITRVQGNSVNSAGSVTSQTVTLPSGITSGNLVVACVACGGNDTTFTGPSGWTQVVINKPAGSATISTSIWYLVVGGAQAGQTSWSWTLSVSHSAYICISEWNASTGWPSNPVDVSATGNTSGSPTTSVTIQSGTTATTAQAEELWISSLAYKGSAQTESGITSGWTRDLEATLASNNTMTMLYDVVSSTGAASCQYTIGVAQHWAGAVATFAPNNASLTLYGSNVADSTLTTASDMATTTGGTETSSATNATGTAVWVEVLSRSATIATVSAIGSPSGKGWVFSPGAGSFATGNWSASVTLSASAPGTTDVTIRFYKYSSGTYTSIGTINKIGVTGTKTTYSFAATSFSSVTFTSTDLLYIDLWWHDTSGADDNPVVYVSNSASAGVVGDMQITTSAFTPNTTTTQSVSVTESALGTELVSIFDYFNQTITETATGTEQVTIAAISANIQIRTITESAPGLELVSILNSFNQTITETSAQTESVKATAIKLISVIESASGSEQVVIQPISYVHPTETATGTETVSTKMFTVVSASIVESALGTEVASFATETISGSDAQMTYSDLQVEYRRIRNNATVNAKIQILARTYYKNATTNKVVYGELDAILIGESVDQMHIMRTINEVSAFLSAYGH